MWLFDGDLAQFESDPPGPYGLSWEGLTKCDVCRRLFLCLCLLRLRLLLLLGDDHQLLCITRTRCRGTDLLVER